MTSIQLKVLPLSAVLLVGLHVSRSQHYVDETNLRTAMLSGYEYKVRPDTTVNVDVRLSLLTINALDVPSQKLSLSGWLTVRWSDSRFTWTPATYGNIEDFYDTELVLWRPLIIVDNAVENLAVLESDKLLVRAEHNGQMTWEPPGIFETYCDVDVTYYPFDTQTCQIEVTSWAYTVTEVDLTARDTEVYLEDYEVSGEWDIVQTWTERRLLVDGLDLHSQIDFILKLQRKPAYYVTTILIPVIVTSLLCILVFLLPVESGEKVGYSLTILLTYTVMLTLVSGYMPPTSKSTSVLSVYLTIVLFVGVFSTLLTVLVLFCYHQEVERPVPNWLTTLSSKLIPVSGWQPLSQISNVGNFDHEKSNANKQNRIHPRSMVVTPADISYRDQSTRKDSVLSTNNETGTTNVSAAQLSWQDISSIIDRLCLRVLGYFIVFLTIIVLMVLLIGGYTSA